MRRIRHMGMIAALTLLAAACTPAPQVAPDKSGAGAPGKPETSKVVLGWAPYANGGVGYRLPEFAKKHGIEVESVVIRAGPDLLTAVINGQVDVGILTYTYLLQALDQGVDMAAVASNMKGGTRIVTSEKLNLAAGDFKGLQELAQQRAASGKKLTIVASRPTINYTLGYLSLTQNGVDVDGLFDFQDVVDFSLHTQMLSSDAADLIITGEPGAALAVGKGWGRSFHYPYDTPAGALNTEFLALRSFAQQSPNTARALVKSIRETSAHLSANKEEHVSDVVKFTGLEAPLAREALNNFTPNVSLDVGAARTLAKILFEKGLVKNDHSEGLESRLLTDLAN
jgi:ABC-type nitrate/sulfonate/bicarbonate transport system substrate-binding protein